MRPISRGIKSSQARAARAVFDQLEDLRRTMWVNDAGQSSFNSNTMLFTTHATVMSWVEGQATRSWHHPDFDPSITTDEAEMLRNRTVLQDVIFDEPEFGELIWLLTADLYAHLADVKQHDWKARSVVERRKLYSAIRSSGAIPSDMSFEAYSELRYLDLRSLQRADVDFKAQPFGQRIAQVHLINLASTTVLSRCEEVALRGLSSHHLFDNRGVHY